MRLLVFATLILSACGSGTTTSAEKCDNDVDDDADGLIDCYDSDCDGSCPFELCDDKVDNDGNGFVDCADAACAAECGENCKDGQDNDGDGRVDCDDVDCDGQCPEVCGDNRDNDGDGFRDCFDVDCDGACPEACDDGRDNDGDGLTDCADEDCDGGCPEVCGDGRDNDGDGLLDCEDDACFGDPTCFESICDDGLDGDGDGLIDCADTDCWGAGCEVTIATASSAASIERVVKLYHSSDVGPGCGSPASGSSSREFVDINSPLGTVQFIGASTPTWTSCDWSAAFTRQEIDGGASPQFHSAMNVSGACGLPIDSTAFLPQPLVVQLPDLHIRDDAQPYGLGGLWFDGSVIGSMNIDTTSTLYPLSTSCWKAIQTTTYASYVTSPTGGDSHVMTTP